MAATFLNSVAGRIKQIAAVVTSSGAADADKVVSTGADGKIDPSLLPTGVGDETTIIAASEDLAGGDFVNIWDDGGTIKVRKADATAEGKEADGYVTSAVTSGNDATVYFEGVNAGLSGLTLGGRYYLSAATAGGSVSTAPSASGNMVQYLGRAKSATELVYEADEGVILA
ncbi:MAG: hypothetical protein ACSHWQ_00075 [Spongiibacteraceae bacterium]